VAGRAVAAEAARIFERLAESRIPRGRSARRSGRGAVGELFRLRRCRLDSAGGCGHRPRVPRLRLDLRLIELIGAILGHPDVEIAVDGAESSDLAGCRVRPLLTEPYLAVVPATSALARRAQVDLVELRDESWVDNDVARGPCRQAVLDACSTVGFSPAFHIETQDYPTAISSWPRAWGSR